MEQTTLTAVISVLAGFVILKGLWEAVLDRLGAWAVSRLLIW